jgi:nucleotide sugar dehydrogenase
MAHAAPKVVVVGLGYVGLPLALEVVSAGLACVGFDNSSDVADRLNAGQSHVDDVADIALQRMLEAGFHATTDPATLSQADVIAICVPTPLSAEGGPDLSAVKSAASVIAEQLVSGQLVVLESTTYPGTTEEVLVPILESSGMTAGRDFNVAFSPERIDPGNEQFGVRNTPKVVGGLTPECSKRVSEFYANFVDNVVLAKGVREAEMTKLLENTYRHVNIALVNEMARFCHELNIDLWDAIRCASTKPFGFQAFRPGPGVGGHCIPIDPNYLSHRVKTHLGQPFRFVELAQEINAGMPLYVARRIQDLLNGVSKPVKGSKVALLGVTYKPDISDQRESPAVQVAEALMNLGAVVSYHDPFVSSWNVNGSLVSMHSSVEDALQSSDIAVLLQAHRSYDLTLLSSSGSLVLDTRGVLSGPTVSRL